MLVRFLIPKEDIMAFWLPSSPYWDREPQGTWAVPKYLSNHRPARSTLEAYGFRVEYDERDCHIVYPPKGWMMEEVDRFWSEIRDALGVTRFSFFLLPDRSFGYIRL